MQPETREKLERFRNALRLCVTLSAAISDELKVSVAQFSNDEEDKFTAKRRTVIQKKESVATVYARDLFELEKKFLVDFELVPLSTSTPGFFVSPNENELTRAAPVVPVEHVPFIGTEKVAATPFKPLHTPVPPTSPVPLHKPSTPTPVGSSFK